MNLSAKRRYRHRKHIRSDKNFIYIFVAALILTVCSLAMSIVPYNSELFAILITDFNVIFTNLLPLFLSLTVLYYIMGSIAKAYLAVSSITFIIAQINRMKLLLRDEPFIFSDIFLIEEAGHMLENYGFTFEKVSAVVLIALAAVLVCLCILQKRE